MDLACATWCCVGASGAEVRPKTNPMSATWPRTNPHQNQKMMEIAVKCKFSACRIESAKLARAGLGPTCLARAAAKVGLKLGPKRQMDSILKPCDVHGNPSQFYQATWHLWRQLHTKLGATEAQHGERCFKQSVIEIKNKLKILVKTDVLGISDWAYVPFEAT